MAIIKCPECGKKISDEAVTCIHCGYPLAEKIIQQELPAADDTQTVDHSSVLRKKNLIRILIPVLSAVTVIAVILAVFLSGPAVEKVRLPYGLQVGMSMDETVQKLRDSGIKSMEIPGSIVFYPEDFCGIKTDKCRILGFNDKEKSMNVFYEFTEAMDIQNYESSEDAYKKNGGSFEPAVRHDDQYYYWDKYDQVKQALVSRYGQPAKEENGKVYWYNKEEKTVLRLNEIKETEGTAGFYVIISAPREE